jgi:hypothetical protein
MACKIVGQTCKLPGEKIPIQVDLTDFCEHRWNSKYGAGIYADGDVVRPTPANRTGFEYECTAAGQVGVEEPRWPIVEGETVQDGSVVWECAAISNASLLKTIDTATWDGDGFEVDTEVIANTNGEQRASCFIFDSSFVQAPGKYLVTVEVLFSDTHTEIFGVQVKMSS